jgi:hypothetical protein
VIRRMKGGASRPVSGYWRCLLVIGIFFCEIKSKIVYRGSCETTSPIASYVNSASELTFDSERITPFCVTSPPPACYLTITIIFLMFL